MYDNNIPQELLAPEWILEQNYSEYLEATGEEDERCECGGIKMEESDFCADCI